jgi:hypothetical protein
MLTRRFLQAGPLQKRMQKPSRHAGQAVVFRGEGALHRALRNRRMPADSDVRLDSHPAPGKRRHVAEGLSGHLQHRRGAAHRSVASAPHACAIRRVPVPVPQERRHRLEHFQA